MHFIKKSFSSPLLWILFIGCVIILFQSQAYRLKSKVEIPTHIQDSLLQLGSRALATGDVPVGAVLVFGDSIVGKGYNTVLRDSNPSHHAEIMALKDFFKSNNNSFGDVNREELLLYSTYEPCEMCKGSMIHYGIKKYVFQEEKSISSQVKASLKGILLNLTSRQMDAPDLQKNLFRQHPDYPLREE